MIIVPAIDLLGGKAVRLKEGRREDATVYHERPWELAATFAAGGAARVHIVDLDGAFAGAPRQLDLVRRVLEAASLPMQVGGGIRDEAAVDAVLGAGARWAVLGTAAVKDPALVERVCRRHPDKVIVAVDARDGRVAVDGWTTTSDIDAVELAARAAGWGAAKILYTDVSRDGLRGGPNVAATARLQAALGAVPVLASGGIGSLADLRALAAAGVRECIVGRAIYDGVFTVAEAVAAC
jgi:phosphoribosylformimino-5-aminoimidazole carboxamide ribotide isomerase